MTDTGNRNSCRQRFIDLKILPLLSLDIYSLLCFAINNIDHYHFVSEIHNRDTKHGFNLNLYHPPVHLSLYQRGSCCIGINIFNSLPLKLK
jgi:hypothetical protein